MRAEAVAIDGQARLLRAMRQSVSALALVGAMVLGAAAQDAVETGPNLTPVSATQFAPTRINPTGRDLNMEVQVRDADFTLGAVPIRISPTDVITVQVERLIEVIGPLVTDRVAESLRAAADGDGWVSIEAANAAGLQISYDAAAIELKLDLRSDERKSNVIQLTNRDFSRPGVVEAPRDFAVYMNYSASFDYIHRGEDEGEFQPIADFVTGVNLYGVVVENEFLYDQDNVSDFERQASRLVWDWESQAIRFTLGDIRVPGRQFLISDDILGISVQRLYNAIQPNRIIRPLGSTSFALDRTSTVDIVVNGVALRSLRLQPGNYDIADFPLTVGGNDVQVIVQDGSGRREVADLSYYLDQELLAPGLFEFSLNYGVASELSFGERLYDEDRWMFVGFARVGIFDFLTAGVSGQADPSGRVYGGELLLATQLGTFGFDAAFSDIDAVGTGWAGRAVYERILGANQPGDLRVRFSTEFWSEGFADLQDVTANQPIELRYAASLGYRLTDDVSLSFGGAYSQYRTATDDVWSGTISASWSINDDMNLQFGVSAENRDGDVEYGVGLRFSARLGAQEFADLAYDSRLERVDASFTRSASAYADDWAADARVSYTPDDANVNGSLSYFSTRGDFSISHNTFYDVQGSTVVDSRSSLRAQGSISYTGGRVALGPTIYDSFAIIDTHESLGDADVLIDSSRGQYTARSDAFGPAVVTLGSYNERSIGYTVPDAPPGYDLGEGSFRVKPSYRSGYKLQVGSDYSVTAIGTLVDSSGKPVALLPGTATYLDSDVEPARQVAIFTNRAGRFVASGLKPGRWKIELGEGDSAKKTAVIVVPEGTDGILRLDPQEAR